MKRWLFRIILIAVVFLAGCGARYKMGGETFSSGSEAIKKQADMQSVILSEMQQTDKPVHGNAIVLIPSDPEIQRNYIRYGANPSSLDKEMLDYLIASARNNFQFMADAIRKRGIFDSLSVQFHNGNPASFPISNNDFKIFADIDGWFVEEKNTPRALPISIDKSKPAGIPRTMSFLDSLSKQASGLLKK